MLCAKMHCLFFITVVSYVLRLAQAAAFPKEGTEKLYDYGKIISPLAVENVDLNGDFVFEGTHSIKYEFDITELLNTAETFISQFLPSQEICERSNKLQLFCNTLEQGVVEIQNELHLTVGTLKTLRSKSEASKLGIGHLTNLPNGMKGNGTSRFEETLKEKEERSKQDVMETVDNCIAEIIQNGTQIQKKRVRDLAHLIIGKIWLHQHERVALIKNTMKKCEETILPLRVINLEALSNDLKTLRQKLERSDFTLAARFEASTEILELALVDCSVTNEQLQVTVHVPVRQSGEWTLTTVKPIIFMFENEQCSILPDDEDDITVALIDGEFEMVGELDDEKIEGGLYVVRRNDRDLQQNYSCWFNIFKTSALSELKDACPFFCRKNDSFISVMPVLNEKYLVSGAKQMNISCGAGEKYIQFPDFGSVEIDLNVCDCNVTFYSQSHTRQLSSPRGEFCADLDEGFPEMVHVIPSQWTKYPGAVIRNGNRLNSLNAIFDRNWKDDNVTREEIETQEEKLEELQKKTDDIEIQIDETESSWLIWAVILFLTFFFLSLGLCCFIRWGSSAAKNSQRRVKPHELVIVLT